MIVRYFIELKFEKGFPRDLTPTVDSRAMSASASLTDLTHRYAELLFVYNIRRDQENKSNLSDKTGKILENVLSTKNSCKQKFLSIRLSTNRNMKLYAVINFFLGFKCVFGEAIYAKAFVTRTNYYASIERSLTLIKHIFLIGFGNGDNGGKSENETDQVFRGSSEVGRVSNGPAAKVQFHYASKSIVASRISWLHNPNKIASLEILVGR